MSEAQYKLEIEKLRAENAKLQVAATQATAQLTITRTNNVLNKKTGKTQDWILVKGFPGIGWGLRAEPRGWQAFIAQNDTIMTQIKALL